MTFLCILFGCSWEKVSSSYQVDDGVIFNYQSEHECQRCGKQKVEDLAHEMKQIQAKIENKQRFLEERMFN